MFSAQFPQSIILRDLSNVLVLLDEEHKKIITPLLFKPNDDNNDNVYEWWTLLPLFRHTVLFYSYISMPAYPFVIY